MKNREKKFKTGFAGHKYTIDDGVIWQGSMCRVIALLTDENRGHFYLLSGVGDPVNERYLMRYNNVVD